MACSSNYMACSFSYVPCNFSYKPCSFSLLRRPGNQVGFFRTDTFSHSTFPAAAGRQQGGTKKKGGHPCGYPPHTHSIIASPMQLFLGVAGDVAAPALAAPDTEVFLVAQCLVSADSSIRHIHHQVFFAIKGYRLDGRGNIGLFHDFSVVSKFDNERRFTLQRLSFRHGCRGRQRLSAHGGPADRRQVRNHLRQYLRLRCP